MNEPNFARTLILGGTESKPPKIFTSTEVQQYLLVQVARALEARKLIPDWDTARLDPKSDTFRLFNETKSNFWLYYGNAAGALDFAMASGKLEEGTYTKLRDELRKVLLSTTL